jgi:hypothetical protein
MLAPVTAVTKRDRYGNLLGPNLDLIGKSRDRRFLHTTTPSNIGDVQPGLRSEDYQHPPPRRRKDKEEGATRTVESQRIWSVMGETKDGWTFIHISLLEGILQTEPDATQPLCARIGCIFSHFSCSLSLILLLYRLRH